MKDKVNTYERLQTLIGQMTTETGGDADMEMTLSKLDRRLIGMALRSIKAVIDSKANTGPFICGVIGEPDAMGLYDKFFVCPQYGLSGTAVYQKVEEYSEPGY